MSMVKLTSPSGWDFDAPTASLIKISSRGFRGNDRDTFIKRAGHEFLPFIDELKYASDEEPVHLIALGETSKVGCNRNGDGFKAAACRAYHPTFVKYARVYRSHINKDPSKSYGLVKKSAYNEDMGRVELIAFLNKTKEAAERNGGLVADKELEKLADKGEADWSMACRVAFDKCSFCHNEAPSRDSYCTAETCKAGGCKDNLGKVVKIGNDIHHLHVDNPHPTWFDISHVFRRADRIALGGKADWLTKAAEDGSLFKVGGALAAEQAGVTVPIEVLLASAETHPDPKMAEYTKIACGLAVMQQLRSAELQPQTKLAFDPRLTLPIDLAKFGKSGSERCRDVLGALADRKVVLPLHEFARLAGREGETGSALTKLAGVFERMLDDDFETRIVKSQYLASTKTACDTDRSYAENIAGARSVDKRHVQGRATLAALRGYDNDIYKNVFVKSASDGEDLAREYACYQVSALSRIASFDDEFPLTARLAIGQNL